MSLLTNVERKGLKGRVFLGGVFILLLLGGVTMVYPFLLMLSGAMRSEMDAAEMNLMPKYLVDDTVLARKFLERKYNHDVSMMNRLRGYRDYSFEQATIPTHINKTALDDYRRFIGEYHMPHHWWAVGGTELYKKLASKPLRIFQQKLKDCYNGDLDALGQDLGAPVQKWGLVSLRFPEWTNPRYDYRPSLFFDAYFAFIHERPLAERAPVSVSGTFLENMIYTKYKGRTPEAYNAAHTRPISAFHRFTLPRHIPGENEPTLRSEWISFVREGLNCSFIRTTDDAQTYQAWLRNVYADIDKLNKRWGEAGYEKFDEIKLPGDQEWIPAARRQDYRAFLETVPLETLYLVGPEYAWTDWLQNRYSTIDRVNKAYSHTYADWSNARIPLPTIEEAYTMKNTGKLRWEMACNNFINVFNAVILQGRPFLNTIIFVGLSLALSLTLQPLAAYALSRFRPPGTWKLILIFMATMAFPPMVGMIPQFLILRNLHLLNTFAALVLPVIVNGYLIFLLKGFFDSLPPHLYEAALIDGASEMRMFREITMSLSKPILAVVALQTFNHAWMAFMYPLLVCPKEEMNVLAVWLYQFQQEAPTSAVFASILVTSIPTLVIFLLTQRTIMRGIAVPAEK